jgi:hypothetical protein
VVRDALAGEGVGAAEELPDEPTSS